MTPSSHVCLMALFNLVGLTVAVRDSSTIDNVMKKGEQNRVKLDLYTDMMAGHVINDRFVLHERKDEEQDPKKYIVGSLPKNNATAGTDLMTYTENQAEDPIWLGTGSFGDVWKAWDKVRQQFVSLKLFYRKDSGKRIYLTRNYINAAGPSDKKDYLQQTLEQAKECALIQSVIQAQSSYPKGRNILCNCFSEHITTAEADELMYLVMEFCGDDLDKVMGKRFKAGDFVPEWKYSARKWMLNLMEGIAFLSGLSQPMIHYDLKPGNVVIDETQTLRIIDFGGLRRYDQIWVAMTRQYAAPEHVESQVQVGNSFTKFSTYPLPYAGSYDTWAAGAIYWELLCREGNSFQPQGTVRFASQDAVNRNYAFGCKVQNGSVTAGRGTPRDFVIIQGMLAFNPELGIPMTKRSKPYKVIQQLQAIIDTDSPPVADTLSELPPAVRPALAADPVMPVQQVPTQVLAPVVPAPVAAVVNECRAWSQEIVNGDLIIEKYGTKDCWFSKASGKLPCVVCSNLGTTVYLKGDILWSKEGFQFAVKVDPSTYRVQSLQKCYVQWIPGGQLCGWLRM